MLCDECQKAPYRLAIREKRIGATLIRLRPPVCLCLSCAVRGGWISRSQARQLVRATLRAERLRVVASQEGRELT